jgi:hypothetical protein
MSRSSTYINYQQLQEAANLSKQNDINQENAGVTSENVAAELIEPRKAFVEPAISVPVDVLEATTFFQTTTSGATN